MNANVLARVSLCLGPSKHFPPSSFSAAGARVAFGILFPFPSPTTSFPLHRLRCEGREGERERERKREAEKLQNGREGLLEGLLRHLPYSFGGRRDSSPSLSPDHPSSIYVYTRGLTNKQDPPPPFPLWSLFMGVGWGGSERRERGGGRHSALISSKCTFPFFLPLCSRSRQGFFCSWGLSPTTTTLLFSFPCSSCM